MQKKKYIFEKNYIHHPLKKKLLSDQPQLGTGFKIYLFKHLIFHKSQQLPTFLP